MLCFSISTANAGFYTGNDVFLSCSKNRAFIEGYVAGAFDKADSDWISFLIALPPPSDKDRDPLLETNSGNLIKGYCNPNGINLSQATDVFCQYLISKPALRHMGADFLLNRALSEAWPCGTKKK